MSNTNYRQLRDFSAQFGCIVGLMWIASFTFYIIGLTHPLAGNISLLLGLLSVGTAGMLVRKFRIEVQPLRFGRAWWMSALIFMYASILMAVAQFIYFRYIDNGLLVDTYSSLMQQPEYIKLMQDMVPGQDAQEIIRQTLDLLRSISPIELTFEFLIYNILFGFLLALPAAWIGLTGKNRTVPSQNH